ncbi:MAG TPA: helix-hairpin-helix domain-containing protein [Candidatus Ignatzschineria merdigallinarum]|uniref:Helix-hairpin-helix domain-containing protein n=1 Tax=Candidatus Ignatzschineria merdigallinarum TaxID=2838621 RepID=A0A9D1TU00_9GAMM|nr:helix-hairpin-helix domain-containing protein [Candidatus Ignatzschineria merdigallinarum]
MSILQKIIQLAKYSIVLISSLAISTTIVLAAPININQADVPTIMDNLSDIGPVKATAIVEYRELNGPFTRAEDLLAVKGIGEKTLEKNRDNLLFNDHKNNEPDVTTETP